MSASRRFRRSVGTALATAAAIVLVVIAAVAVAHARPGGGHSYSGGHSFSSHGFSSHSFGGGHYSSSHSSGDGGALFELIIWLLVLHPTVGVPIAIIAVIAVIVAKRKNDGLGDWDFGDSIATAAPSPTLDAVRAIDAEFSEILFSDFAYSLYAAAQRARHVPAELDKLGPYLSPETRRDLHGRPPTGEPVTAVIVGAMRVSRIQMPPDAEDPDALVKVTLRFESNLTVGHGSGARNHFTEEAWTLMRRQGARSRPPGSTRTFNCPNCGAPFESTDDATCSYCGEVVAGGRFDWAVIGVMLVREELRPPKLTGHAPERGTRLETVHHPTFVSDFEALQADDPSVTHEGLYTRLQHIFLELNRSWSALDLRPARPFVSDGMNDYLGYWVEAYRSQGLRNVTENPTIKSWDLCRVIRDRYYDSVVVRIFAESLDYTIEDRTGEVVGGSRSRPRAYSEYWTLSRAAGIRQSPADAKKCPNCGAELAINMGGHCEYCGVHVTAGEFDWVLSKIEQDEAYSG